MNSFQAIILAMTQTPPETKMFSIRLTASERTLIEEAAEMRGWKIATFLRFAALERAAAIVNMSRPTSLDFARCAREVAACLAAERHVDIMDIDRPDGQPLERAGEWQRFDQLVESLGEVDSLGFGTIYPPRLQSLDQVAEAIRLGGPEFFDAVLIECRRLVSGPTNPALPPPIDPKNLNA